MKTHFLLYIVLSLFAVACAPGKENVVKTGINSKPEGNEQGLDGTGTVPKSIPGHPTPTPTTTPKSTPHSGGNPTGPTPTPSYDTSPTPSPISENPLRQRSLDLYASVDSMVTAMHQKSRGTNWNETKITLEPNWILSTIPVSWGMDKIRPQKGDCPSGVTGCQPQFNRKICSKNSDCEDQALQCLPLRATVFVLGKEPDKVCQFPSDHLLDALYTTVIQSKQSIDMTSLSAPNGLFNEALINALSIVSQQASNVKIRILFSGLGENDMFGGDDPSVYFGQLRDGIKARKGNTNSLVFNIGWLSDRWHQSWNHSKIIIVDGKYGLQGGHNWWSDDYLGYSPITDLSMFFHGQALKDATNYIDTLWSHIDSEDDDYSFYQSGVHFPKFSSIGNFEEEGKALALSLGRLGYYGDNAADDGIKALIDGAQDEIFIGQQDMFSKFTTNGADPPFVEQNLFNAILKGVKITIVQSNPVGDDYGWIMPMIAYKNLKSDFVTYIQAHSIVMPNGTDTPADYFCKQLSYHSLRFAADWNQWGNGQNLGLHNKLIIVDKAAFYIGSQNLYPADLQEYGFAVFNADYTAELLTNYWDPILSKSIESEISCSGL